MTILFALVAGSTPYSEQFVVRTTHGPFGRPRVKPLRYVAKQPLAVGSGCRGYIAGTALATLHSELARWNQTAFVGKQDLQSVEMDIDPSYFVNTRPMHHKVTQHE